MSSPRPPAAPCPDRETTARLAALRSRDALDAAGEELLARHVAACATCLAGAVAVDPTILFVRLSASAEAEEDASRGAHRIAREARDEAAEAEILAADVLVAIRVRDAEETGRSRRGRAARSSWLRAAAVALLASGLAAVLYLRKPALPVASAPAPGTAGATAALRPIVERLENPGARVYQFAASSPTEPTVVFVANPDADL
jgi:hypothetical protein